MSNIGQWVLLNDDGDLLPKENIRLKCLPYPITLYVFDALYIYISTIYNKQTSFGPPLE